jgi:hypothetical protein
MGIKRYQRSAPLAEIWRLVVKPIILHLGLPVSVSSNPNSFFRFLTTLE